MTTPAEARRRAEAVIERALRRALRRTIRFLRLAARIFTPKEVETDD